MVGPSAHEPYPAGASAPSTGRAGDPTRSTGNWSDHRTASYSRRDAVDRADTRIDTDVRIDTETGGTMTHGSQPAPKQELG
jgi:hypothetical protein